MGVYIWRYGVVGAGCMKPHIKEYPPMLKHINLALMESPTDHLIVFFFYAYL